MKLQAFPGFFWCVPSTAPASEKYFHNVGVRHGHCLWESLSSGPLGTRAPPGGHSNIAEKAGKRQLLSTVTWFSLLLPAWPPGLLLVPYFLPDRFIGE